MDWTPVFFVFNHKRAISSKKLIYERRPSIYINIACGGRYQRPQHMTRSEICRVPDLTRRGCNEDDSEKKYP
jgi:hypothetical protein